MNYKLILLFLFTFSIAHAQTPTIGLLYTSAAVTEGYTLFTPGVDNRVFLINNCGEKVHQWTFNDFPGATCYLLENGTLLRAGKKFLEIRDWDNNILWNYNKTENQLFQHHDIEPLPNGNILCVVRDTYSDVEIISQGKDAQKVSTNIDLDKIVELKPVGTNEVEVVWEWKFIDHLVQDYDSSKPNFGKIADYPGRININYEDPYFINRDRGFTHVNSVDYNADLDQIIISARHLNEIYIIDHSTTTAEAKGSSGGNSKRGGDILWRWGNPMVYGKGTLEDQKLFLQHDAKWVENGYLEHGEISVFNNGLDEVRPFSSVHLIEPEVSGYTYASQNNQFKPDNFSWTWSGAIQEHTMYETKQSGGHSLLNGNFIICETSLGQISEISRQGEILWTYKNPVGDQLFDQYETVPQNLNSIFRAEKYPSTYAGFAGKDLTPKGIIENENPLTDKCATLGIEEIKFANLKVFNPITGHQLKFNKTIKLEKVSIIDINGRIVFQAHQFFDDHVRLNVQQGLYVLELVEGNAIKRIKIIVE